MASLGAWETWLQHTGSNEARAPALGSAQVQQGAYISLLGFGRSNRDAPHPGG